MKDGVVNTVDSCGQGRIHHQEILSKITSNHLSTMHLSP